MKPIVDGENPREVFGLIEEYRDALRKLEDAASKVHGAYDGELHRRYGYDFVRPLEDSERRLEEARIELDGSASTFVLGANATRRWRHVDGWTLTHCGHPTAIHPWILKTPAGDMVLTGVLLGNPPTFGTAWSTLRAATEWHALTADAMVTSTTTRQGREPCC